MDGFSTIGGTLHWALLITVLYSVDHIKWLTGTLFDCISNSWVEVIVALVGYTNMWICVMLLLPVEYLRASVLLRVLRSVLAPFTPTCSPSSDIAVDVTWTLPYCRARLSRYAIMLN